MAMDRILLSGTAVMALLAQAAFAEAALAQTPASSPAAVATAAADASDGDEIVVTGTIRPERKIDTSIAISTVNADTISQINPQSAADLIRFIPGIRSEASGGEGNANISVRGLPVASGGAKFVQFQEDGIPVLLFGDIAFGTADAFVKSDYNIARVEVVRGGSASTATDNAPGAILNFITKTGEKEGGAIGVTRGIDFDRTRVDFDYGGPISDSLRFHVGGFYDYGKGVKDGGYTAENGGQLKANITKTFDSGFIRLDFKFLDDRSPVYLPVPVAINRNGTGASYGSIPGFDVRSDALQSPALQSLLSINGAGNRVTDSVSDGYRTLTKAFGGEAQFDLGNGITLRDKFRYAINSGAFVGPYPASVGSAQSLGNAIGGEGARVTFATGPNAGQAYAGTAVNTVYFNTTLNNFNTFTNDLTLSKEFDAGSAGRITATVGYTKSGQHIGMDWHWTDYLLSAQGHDAGGAQLLNVTNAAGVQQTQNGLVGYYATGFGCGACQRVYDVQYSVDAPWLNLNWKIGKLSLDGSLRYDVQSARGTYQQAATPATIDVNQDGIIQPTEKTVYVATSGTVQPVNYTKRYVSYSIGANYAIGDNLALFGRASRGARFNADRVIPGDASGNVLTPLALNFANQQEAGVKFADRHFAGALTYFHTTTAEFGTDITPQGVTFFGRNYRANGLELEGSATFGGFSVFGGVTYTDAKIVGDAITPGDIGNRPQRQAKWVYQLRPTYTTGPVAIGASLVGTSNAFTDSSNTLTQPGYTVIGLFGDYAITPALHISAHVDNLFNKIGITEVDSAPGGNGAGIGSARSILGRQISAGIKFAF